MFSNTVLVGQEGEMLKPELGPLIEPEAVKFTFDTPGWYVLAGLILLFAIILSLKWFKNYKKNAYRRKAIKEIESNKQSEINEVLVLLKIVATTTFGRKEVAQLHGNEWLQFLESKAKNTPFTNYKDDILNSLYKGIDLENEKREIILELSKKWIKTHA